tara:strand:+ start:316 stop:891 length:576 start_codon:yes stop_codon:yes gene_type:complete
MASIKNVGKTGLKVWQRKSLMADEINRIRTKYGKHGEYKSKIEQVLGAKTKVFDGSRTKAQLAGLLVSLREQGVPISPWLEQQERFRHVKRNADSTLFTYTCSSTKKRTENFLPFNQAFIRNTMCTCGLQQCDCLAVRAHIQLSPATNVTAASGSDSSNSSEDEVEEIERVDATIDEVQAMIAAQIAKFSN